MSPAPVNVCLYQPEVFIEGWDIQQSKWLKLNQDIGGNPDFYPLTIKAFYLFGVLLALFESVQYLLEDGKPPQITYLPAYSLFASGVDILGRCLRGNTKTWDSSKDIKAGFRWLANPTLSEYADVPGSYTLVSTINGPYTISDLISLRHFTSHGQAATSGELPFLDYFILSEMPPLIAGGLENYWSTLKNSAEACNLLAMANIFPYRNRPIFDTLWSISGDIYGNYPALGDLFGPLDWTYKHPKIK